MNLQLLLAASLLLVQNPPPPKPPPSPPEPKPPAQKPEEQAPLELKVDKLTKPTADGVTLTADYYQAPFLVTDRPMFVCFHMEHGSRAEFAKIAPRFAEYACSTFAVDLRNGDTADNVANETAASAKKVLGKSEFTNEEAFADVVAALKWAKEIHPAGKIFALGSGTSAALVLVAVARNPGIADAMFLFSPGEDVPGWSVAVEAKKVTIPTYVTCDGNAAEAARARPIGHALGKIAKVVVPLNVPGAAHGSAVLVQTDDAMRQRHWSTVISMILSIAPIAPPAASSEPPTKNP